MTPSQKSPEMEEFLTRAFGKDRREQIKSGICMWCNGDVLPNSFKDTLSAKEFAISGLCQTCQNKVFD